MPSRASPSDFREHPSRPILHLPKTRKPPAPRSPDTLDFKEARKELIRNAASARAAKRGVRFGFDVEDWRAAEAEIDARLNE
jgi:Protein of unknown function (DUF2934)